MTFNADRPIYPHPLFPEKHETTFDVRNLATHEMGHFGRILNMADSDRDPNGNLVSCKGQTMWPNFGYTDHARETIETYDTWGINWQYPKGPGRLSQLGRAGTSNPGRSSGVRRRIFMIDRIRGRSALATTTAVACAVAVGLVASDKLRSRPSPGAAVGHVAVAATPVAGQREPITIEVDSGGTWSTPSERFRGTPLIVQGTVAEVHPSRWNTPDGQLPPGTTAANISFDSAIYTDYTIAVDRVLRGTLASETVRVRTLGGQVGPDSYREDFDARFAQGQRVLLLLGPDQDPLTERVGPEHYEVAYGFRGKYEVSDGEAVSEDRRQGGVNHRVMLAELSALLRANPYTPAPVGTPTP